MSTFTMAERARVDGPMAVRAPDDNTIVVEVTHDGVAQAITMSRFNAARVFGALAVMLGIALSRSVGKAIKF